LLNVHFRSDDLIRFNCKFENTWCDWKLITSQKVHLSYQDEGIRLVAKTNQQTLVQLDIEQEKMVEVNSPHCLKFQYSSKRVYQGENVKLFEWKLLGISVYSRMAGMAKIRPNGEQMQTVHFRLKHRNFIGLQLHIDQILDITLHSIEIVEQDCPVNNFCNFYEATRCISGLNPEDFQDPFGLLFAHFPIKGTQEQHIFLENRLGVHRGESEGRYDQKLQLPDEFNDEANVCIRITYEQHKEWESTLKMLSVVDSKEQMLFTSAERNHDYSHHIGLVNLNWSDKPQILLSVEKDDLKQQAPDIKSVGVYKGACPSSGSCDFRQGDWCGYRATDSKTIMGFTIGKPRLRDARQVTNLDLNLLETGQVQAYFDLTGLNSKTYAILNHYKVVDMTSPPIPPIVGGSLRFRYTITGTSRIDPHNPITATLSWHQLINQDEHYLFTSEGDTKQASTVCINLNSESWSLLQLIVKFEFVSKPYKMVPYISIAFVQVRPDVPCSAEEENEDAIRDDEDEDNPDALANQNIDCQFAEDLCDWTTKDWKSSSDVQSDAFPYLGINGDPLTKTGMVFFESEGERSASLSKKVKVNSKKNGQKFCLRFALFMSPKSQSALSVLATVIPFPENPNNPTGYLPKMAGEDYWAWQQFDISAANHFQLNLLAKVSDSVIGVQYLTLRHGECHQPLLNEWQGTFTCTFERDTCGFYPSSADRIRFARIESSETLDHTYRTKKGHIMAVSVQASIESDESTDLTYELAPNDDGYCVRFWALSRLKGELNLNYDSDSSGETIKILDQLYLDQIYYPFQAQIEPNDISTVLGFTFNYAKGAIGMLALDDITIETGLCPALHTCTFEYICMWDSMFDEQFRESSAMDKPLGSQNRWYKSYTKAEIKLGDVTLRENGHYLIYQDKGASALYRSPILDTLQVPHFCLTVNHRALTNKVAAKLRILVALPDSYTLKEIAMIERSADSSGAWRKERQTFEIEKVLGRQVDQLVVYLAAVPDNADDPNEVIHMHLDDLSIQRGECPNPRKQFPCGDVANSYVYSAQVCDQTIDCPNGADEKNCIDCDFRSSLCGYRDEDLHLEHVLNSWRVQNTLGDTRTGQSPIDLQRNAAVSTRNHEELERSGHSWLRGPLIHSTYGECAIEFSYWAKESEFSLTVQGEGNELMQLWKTSPKSTDEWITERVQVGPMRQQLRFIFNQQFTGKVESSLALSDVRTLSCAPLTAKDDNGCAAGQFPCTNGVCISADLVCDLENNCGDYSDERYCEYDVNRCNFESGTCEWSLLAHSNKDWNMFERIKAKYSLDQGPTRDHTRNWKDGHYLLFSTRFPEANNQAEVRGVHLNVQVGCKMRLFYMSTGGELSVHLRDLHGKPEVRQKLKLKYDYNWNRMQVKLDKLLSEPDEYRVTIKSVLANSRDFIAIDDITFSPECYAHADQLLTCDFGAIDTSFCQWSSSLSSKQIQIQTGASEEARLWIPKRPNFLMFTYVKSTRFVTATQTLVLTSPLVVWPGPDKYLHLHYYQSGTQVGRLQLIDVMNQNQVVFENSFSSDRWREICIPLKELRFAEKMQIRLVITLPSPHTTVALSQMEITKATCKSTFCSFDSDDCILMQTDQGPSSWRHSKSASEAGQQQFKDHTWQTTRGGYLFADSIGAVEKSVLSTPLTRRLKHCIRFWHNRFELPLAPGRHRDVAELTVSSQFSKSNFYFRSIQGHTNEWRKAVINVQTQRSEKFMFHSDFVGKEGNLLMAVDDVEILPGKCHVIDCTFDEDMCEWSERDHETDRNWIRTTGAQLKTFQNDFLPSIDSSEKTNKGGMLWTHFENAAVLSVASLVGPEFLMDRDEKCLEFDLFIPKEADVRFQVVAVDAEKTCEMYSSLSNVKPRGQWSSVEVNLRRIHESEAQFVKLLAVKLGEKSSESKLHYTDSVAIDNIRLSSSSCDKIRESRAQKEPEVAEEHHEDNDYYIDLLHKQEEEEAQKKEKEKEEKEKLEKEKEEKKKEKREKEEKEKKKTESDKQKPKPDPIEPTKKKDPDNSESDLNLFPIQTPEEDSNDFDPTIPELDKINNPKEGPIGTSSSNANSHGPDAPKKDPNSPTHNDSNPPQEEPGLHSQPLLHFTSFIKTKTN
jgi:outer membrane biosynthesis protein TonB